MSNIYIQEPPTDGKVCLHTTVGDIDIELWSKECPKACRNFVQLCMEGYYNNTIFHRVVAGFIVQGGDPTGTGEGGESIYGAPFKDEIHSRLRFVRRGLVAMANAGANDNGSQFFFTLAQCPDLQNKHTLFGKVVGDTLYNMLKLGEVDVDQSERPLHPPKILSADVLNNPFKDIVPRVSVHNDKEHTDEKPKSKSKMSATKNFSLLSFGEEANEEEGQLDADIKSRGGKSAHDLLQDEKLSDLPAYSNAELGTAVDDSAEDREQIRQNVREKLSRSNVKKSKISAETAPVKREIVDPGEQGEDEPLIWADKRADERLQLESARAEALNLKRELKAKKEPEGSVEPKEQEVAPVVKQYYDDRKRYDDLKKTLPGSKTSEREQQTLAMLDKFQSRLRTAKEKAIESVTLNEETNVKRVSQLSEDSEGGVSEDEIDLEGSDWLGHVFKAEVIELRQAKDANMKTDESFDLHDPRNPMNIRRRKADKLRDDQSREKRRR